MPKLASDKKEGNTFTYGPKLFTSFIKQLVHIPTWSGTFQYFSFFYILEVFFFQIAEQFPEGTISPYL